MKVTELRTNHIKNPLGFFLDKPTLSWKVTGSRGAKTKSARVVIATDPRFRNVVSDSGEAALNPLCYAPDIRVKPRERYYWKVRVTDDAGDSAWSKPAFFEAGPDTVSGTWIKAPKSVKGHAIFMKEFHLPSEVRRARLYISGLGLFRACINGEKVGDEYLTPLYNDYNHWIQVMTYDVADMLRVGENAFGVMLGNGWYMGRFGFIDRMDKLYGEEQQFIMELDVEFADGSRARVSSDTGFLAHESPVKESSLYDGEVYDARKEVPGFGTADCKLDSANGWKKAVKAADLSDRLFPRLSLPVVARETLPVKEIIRTPAGETVLDFGQILSGTIRVRVREKAGAVIRMQFGELLQDGNFYTENLRTAKQELIYTSDGHERIYEPRFTSYGFRYALVEGIKKPRAEDFTAVALYSDIEETGKIRTDNKEINRLFQNALWSQKGNFLDVPTDCPQRDERMGWTGDAQVFCATASFNMYTPAFFRKYMHDMLLEQREPLLGGAVPHVVPDILDQINRRRGMPQKSEWKDGVFSFAAGSCVWGDAAAIIPWSMYLFYGNTERLAKEYENMKRWVDWIRRVDREQCGNKHLWNTGFHFADWLALDNHRKGESFGGTDPFFVASCFYYYSARLTAKAAKVLGKEKDAALYAKTAEDVREAIRREYFTPTGRIAAETQTAMVLALYFDIVPTSARARLIRDLRKKLEAEKMHFTTGFAGTAYLCLALTKCGLTEDAYTLLLNRDYPSWLYEVSMGATTIWERWNSVLPDGHMSDTGMNSLNHYAYGAVVEWMYRVMGGLNPDEASPGFKHFFLRPEPDARFRRFEMSYESGYGLIACSWKRVKKDWELTVTVPFDTTATFVVPPSVARAEIDGKKYRAGREAKLAPGNYRILLITE